MPAFPPSLHCGAVDAALRARLTAIAGDKAVDAASGTVAPGTAEQVEEICAACSEAGVRIAVTGAAPAAAVDGAVVVSLAHLADVTVEADRLVLRAGAGATLRAVRGAAAQAGLVLTGVPAGVPDDTTAGALVARGRVSRRALTGVEAVLAGGGRVASGGAMLKDVAGYDLIATLLGSMGRLALVTAVTFRLQPSSAPQDAAEPAGVPTPVLGDALERAFDPQRLLVARG
jgi:FAD/FMN-containing dehydrogenase